MAGQLRCQSGTHPYTYYQQIRLLDSGSIYLWNLFGGPSTHFVYWSPTYQPEYNTSILVDELTASFEAAVKRRTLAHLGPVGVFLSGGSDSRLLLFAAEDRSLLTAVTLYDQPNSETLVAGHLAEAAGIPHVLLRRDAEYYPRTAQRVMRIAGGMWNFVDGHFLGHHETLANQAFGTILTGDFADYFFKGLAQNRRRWRLFGKPLPIYSRGKFNYEYYLSFKPIAERWREAVDERLRGEFSDIETNRSDDEGLLEIERRRLFPVSYDGDFAARSTLWRTLPWDHFLCDIDVLGAYLHIPVSLKLNGQIFGDAVSRICSEASDIPNANTQLPVNADRSAKLIGTLLRSFRNGLDRSSPDGAAVEGVATQGSWPNWHYVVGHSEVLNDLWQSAVSEERDLINELTGQDAWKRSLGEWAELDAEYYTRIFSLFAWYRNAA